MSIENPDFYCHINEYRDNVPKRIADPEKLLQVGRCTLMLSLDSTISGRQAGRLQSNVQNVETHDSGIHTVEYRILNPESLPILEGLSQMENGFMLHLDETLHLMNARVSAGYFLGEEPDEFDNDWGEWNRKHVGKDTRVPILV